MDADQELLDRFAIAAVYAINLRSHDYPDEFADECWRIAIAMKQARDRIFTTAKPADENIPPFPAIDGTAIPEKPSVIAAERLGFEPFAYCERS